MKELLLNIITKIIDNIKNFIWKTSNNIKFEDRKSKVIKAIYDPMLEKKIEEKNVLLSELNNLKQQRLALQKQINKIEEENKLYSKKINALNKFQDFILRKVAD